MVTGAGPKNTGFNGIVSLVCFTQINSDVEMKSPRRLTEQARGVRRVTCVGKRIRHPGEAERQEVAGDTRIAHLR